MKKNYRAATARDETFGKPETPSRAKQAAKGVGKGLACGAVILCLMVGSAACSNQTEKPQPDAGESISQTQALTTNAPSHTENPVLSTGETIPTEPVETTEPIDTAPAATEPAPSENLRTEVKYLSDSVAIETIYDGEYWIGENASVDGELRLSRVWTYADDENNKEIKVVTEEQKYWDPDGLLADMKQVSRWENFGVTEQGEITGKQLREETVWNGGAYSLEKTWTYEPGSDLLISLQEKSEQGGYDSEDLYEYGDVVFQINGEDATIQKPVKICRYDRKQGSETPFLTRTFSYTYKNGKITEKETRDDKNKTTYERIYQVGKNGDWIILSELKDLNGTPKTFYLKEYDEAGKLIIKIINPRTTQIGKLVWDAEEEYIYDKEGKLTGIKITDFKYKGEQAHIEEITVTMLSPDRVPVAVRRETYDEDGNTTEVKIYYCSFGETGNYSAVYIPPKES